MQSMTSTRPYMIRAMHEWLEDNLHTPYLQVDADQDYVEVPRQYVRDGRIILNISSAAVQGLTISDEGVFFSARFNKIPTNVYVPIAAVMAIYSKENNLGMFFDQFGDIVPPPPTKGPDPSSPTPGNDGKPSLRVVK